MAKKIEIPVEVNFSSLQEARSQLKQFRDDLTEAIGAGNQEAATAIAQKIGKIKDALQDANEQVKIFTSGSKFESLSNNNCNGNIFSNSNTSNIEFNSNTGSIQNNTSGISSISKNANNGSISGNTSGSSFSIQNNINNGNIGPGTLVANIVDPIVNK